MLGWFRQEVFRGAAQQRLFQRGTPILAYHKIATPLRSRDPFLYTHPECFKDQLNSLKQSGFAFGTLDTLFEPSRKPNRSAVITFDDGFVNVLENALPILAKAEAIAIQFIVAGLIGGRNEWDIRKGDVAEPLMDESQIETWLAAGHQIGSHSMTHRNLKKLSLPEAREEIFNSKKTLEDKFGIKVKHFSYPFGGYNPQVRDLVAEAGYATACSMDFGVNDFNSDRFSLRRIIPLSSGELLRKAVHRLSRD